MIGIYSIYAHTFIYTYIPGGFRHQAYMHACIYIIYGSKYSLTDEYTQASSPAALNS